MHVCNAWTEHRFWCCKEKRKQAIGAHLTSLGPIMRCCRQKWPKMVNVQNDRGFLGFFASWQLMTSEIRYFQTDSVLTTVSGQRLLRCCHWEKWDRIGGFWSRLQKIKREKMNLIQTESVKGSHGLLTYASNSCFGGTTPCPKVIRKKEEKNAKNKTKHHKSRWQRLNLTGILS